MFAYDFLGAKSFIDSGHTKIGSALDIDFAENEKIFDASLENI